jgi:hypothetical protein
MPKTAKKYSAKTRTQRVTPHLHTFHALHEWHKAMFEKLGWMILAKEHGYVEKIQAYKAAIQYLKSAIEKKMKVTREIDRKNDLKILWANTCVLIEHANKDF